MRPAPFEYLAPRSPEEAVDWLSRRAGDARLLAGGQSLIPLLNLRMARPATLIDLGRCEGLAYVRREGARLFRRRSYDRARSRRDAARSALPDRDARERVRLRRGHHPPPRSHAARRRRADRTRRRRSARRRRRLFRAATPFAK